MIDTVVVVYGNHGPAPVQIDDHLEYLVQAFGLHQTEIRLSETPEAGHPNILIEGFTSRDVDRVSSLAATGTRFVCIATEFLTGATFNDCYEEKRPPAYLRFLPRGRHKRNYYQNKATWIERYTNFAAIAERCDAIWCLDEAQFAGYQAKFGKHARRLPIVALLPPDQVNSQRNCSSKDVDFLFTGTLTPHRTRILDELAARGLKVVIGSSRWTSLMREHYVRRAKVCLDIRQSPDWKYSSCMRLHKLLCSHATIAVEQSSHPSLQESCIGSAPTTDFVDYALELHASASRNGRGYVAYDDYYALSEADRSAVSERLSELLDPAGK